MAVTAHKLGPGVLSLGETGTLREFSSQVTNARWTPSVDQEDPIPVLSGDQIVDDPDITSVIAGTVPPGLRQRVPREVVLGSAAGEVLAFEFKPRNDSELTISGECQVLPVEVGGDVKTRNTTDFEFPVVGEPTFADTVGG